MRKTGRLFPLLILLLLAFSNASRGDLPDIVYKQGYGVRATGMGGAYTAVANDASALFYNPAGLAEAGVEISTSNLDTQQTYSNYYMNAIKLGYFGYSWGKATDTQGSQISVNNFGFGNRSGWLNYGATIKMSEWNLPGNNNNNGWTSDIGFLARLTPQLKVGFNAQDIISSKAKITPASARLGVAYKPFDGQLLLAADLELYRASQQDSTHFGVQLGLTKGLAVRGGYDRGIPTAGLSLDLSILSFDYAIIFPSNGKSVQQFQAGIRISEDKARPYSIIKPKEYAIIDISGSIKGGVTEVSMLGGVHPGLDTILETIRAAGKDPGIDGIMIRLGGFSGGLGGAAVVQEIRDELSRARAKGKKIVVYIEGSALGDEYYLASIADTIVAAPGSAIGGFGKSIEIYRMPGLFKKFGIEWQVIAKGEYKTTFDWLSPGTTANQKKMLESIINDIYRQMLTDIAQGRNMKLSKVKEIGDGLLYPSGAAQKMGLIDNIGYLRDACLAGGKLCGTSDEVKLVQPAFIDPEEDFFAQVFGVAVVEVNGEIVTGAGGSNFLFGGSYAGSDKVVSDIRRAADDMFVRAIVLRIDSPGGSPVAAGEITQAIKYAKEKKKVVIASLGSVAASGGYYIAAAADKIVADPATITGSIGVIGSYPAFDGLMKKLGITTEVVKEGAHADMFSGLRKFNTAEVKAMRRIINETYNDFINAVVQGRKLTTKEVEAAAQGRVYTGAQALEIKLVDKLGGFSDAVDLAKEESNLSGDPRLVYYRDNNPFLQFGQGVTSSLGLFPLKL